MEQVFIQQGDKYIPLQRFDLKPADASTAFGKSDGDENKAFEVRRHPIVQSIKAENINGDQNALATQEEQTDASRGTQRKIAKGNIIEHLQQIGKTQTETIELPGRLGHLTVDSHVQLQTENYPLITDESELTSDSVLTSRDGTQFMLPDIELSPYQGRLFYYETEVDSNGKPGRYIGRITLGYQLKQPANVKGAKILNVDVDSVRLNLKTNKGVVSIDGIVDQEKKELIIEPIGEAVKIAFFNLVSQVKPNQCDVDVFYKFVGESLQPDYIAFQPKPIEDPLLGNRIPDWKLEEPSFLKPTIVGGITKPNVSIGSNIKDPNITISGNIKNPDISIGGNIKNPNISIGGNIKNPRTSGKLSTFRTKSRGTTGTVGAIERMTYVKSTYIVKINKRLSYPFETYQNLYHDAYGVLKGNPFKLNDDFAEYEQIYCDGINRDLVNVYKSLFSKNTFLLLPTKYYLARNEERPCIYSSTFLSEEGVSTQEQVIDRINFSFTIAPALSDFELAKMRVALFKNGKLDKDFSSENIKKRLFDETAIRFKFPNDIGADTYIDGDEFLATADITLDGRYFNIICETQDLSKASLFITAINGAQERYFNIKTQYKEIHNEAVAELNMNKTIGEFLNITLNLDSLLISNKSYSPCNISEMMLVDTNNNVFYNSEYFKKNGKLESGKEMTITLKNMVNTKASLKLSRVFLDYESIEDLSKEFRQVIDQVTAYYRNIVLDLSAIDDKNVYRMKIDVMVMSTGCVFSFNKAKADFEQPILVTIITKNDTERNTLLKISRKYIGKNGNTIKTDTLQWDYSKGALIDLSLSKQ